MQQSDQEGWTKDEKINSWSVSLSHTLLSADYLFRYSHLRVSKLTLPSPLANRRKSIRDSSESISLFRAILSIHVTQDQSCDWTLIRDLDLLESSWFTGRWSHVDVDLSCWCCEKEGRNSEISLDFEIESRLVINFLRSFRERFQSRRNNLIHQTNRTFKVSDLLASELHVILVVWVILNYIMKRHSKEN